MQQLADDLWQLSGFPTNAVNVYVIGDVLIDAGMRLDRGRILKQVDGRESQRARAHARAPRPLRREPCDLRAPHIPLWCGAADAEAVEPARWSRRAGA